MLTKDKTKQNIDFFFFVFLRLPDWHLQQADHSRDPQAFVSQKALGSVFTAAVVVQKLRGNVTFHSDTSKKHKPGQKKTRRAAFGHWIPACLPWA